VVKRRPHLEVLHLDQLRPEHFHLAVDQPPRPQVGQLHQFFDITRLHLNRLRLEQLHLEVTLKVMP